MTSSVTNTNSTPTTGLLSSAGIGSGLDVKSIVAAMVNAEAQPLNDLQSAASDLKTKLSAFGQVKSYVSAFRDAVSKLSQPELWNTTNTSTSNAAAVTASTDSNASPGSYSVVVTQLAMAQTLSSKVFAATDAVGEGTLSIQKTGAASPVSVSISATDTLANVRDKINASDSGITAHIQTDSTGARLVLQSKDTGSSNGFTINASDSQGNAITDGAGLGALAYDPATSSNALTQQQAGVDAQASINGVAVTSTSNTLSNVLDGLTLNLNGTTATGTPATVSVARDTASTKTAITDMVTAYNALQNYIVAQTKYDPGTKTAATLQGDSATNSVRNQMRTVMGSNSTASSTFTRFSDIGFDIKADGTITVNDAKLTAAIGKPDELRKLFANTDIANPANDGLGTQLRKLADGMLGSDGVLTSRTSGLQNSITYNSKRQADYQTRLDKYQARVQAQYTALDTQMASLNSLSSYVTQQVAQMNKSSG